MNIGPHPRMTPGIELEPEEDGRWVAEIFELTGVTEFGQAPENAKAKAEALATFEGERPTPRRYDQR